MRDLTNGLAASNANLHFALRQIGTTDLKYYAASLVGEELNSLESDQLPDRIAFRPVAAYVDLNNLVAFASRVVPHQN